MKTCSFCKENVDQSSTDVGFVQGFFIKEGEGNKKRFLVHSECASKYFKEVF